MGGGLSVWVGTRMWGHLFGGGGGSGRIFVVVGLFLVFLAKSRS